MLKVQFLLRHLQSLRRRVKRGTRRRRRRSCSQVSCTKMEKIRKPTTNIFRMLLLLIGVTTLILSPLCLYSYFYYVGVPHKSQVDPFGEWTSEGDVRLTDSSAAIVSSEASSSFYGESGASRNATAAAGPHSQLQHHKDSSSWSGASSLKHLVIISSMLLIMSLS